MQAYKNLLRPPVEWLASGVSCMAAALLWQYPMTIGITAGLARWLSGGLIIFALYRGYQGYRVYHYQRHLWRLPRYARRSDQLPHRAHQLFLGQGFAWQVKHSQRWYDLMQQDRKRAARSTPTGGHPALHGVEPHEQPVFMALAERVGHTLVLGTTRVGKTRLAEILCAQDIQRGEVVIVFDPKGDVQLLRRLFYECQRAGRLSDLVIFHLGFPQHSARYNPIGSFARLTEVANRVANQLPGSGESAAFKEFAWRFINIIAQALVALGQKPNYKLLNRYLLDSDALLLAYCQQYLPTIDPNWQQGVVKQQAQLDDKKLPYHLKTRSPYMIALTQYVKQLDVQDNVLNGLCAMFAYDQTYYQKITASLSPLLEKLTTGQIAALISPDYFNLNDERPIFDWLQVIRGKKVVYVGLDALSDTTVATAVGNSMFADLCSVAGQLYKFGVEDQTLSDHPIHRHYPINIHADEFNELIGEEFVPLLNKAGGAGMRVTAYTQTGSDIEARLGSRAKTGQVLGNLNNVICLRVLDAETARLFVDKLPKVTVQQHTAHSSVHDQPDLKEAQHFSTTYHEQHQAKEVPLLQADQLLVLPKGQAFCLLHGGQLWKVRIPLPQDDMDEVPTDVAGMVKAMQSL